MPLTRPTGFTLRGIATRAALILCVACVGTEDPITTGASQPEAQSSPQGDPQQSARVRAGETLELRVQRLADGDSFRAVDRNGHSYQVRLAAIDAPERKQPGAQAATDLLRRLLGDQWISLHVRKMDRYGRLVGRVLVNKRDAGLELVRNGVAWHFKRFEKEQPPNERQSFRMAEEAARQAGKGLWRQSNPQPPWEWRQQNRRRQR